MFWKKKDDSSSKEFWRDSNGKICCDEKKKCLHTLSCPIYVQTLGNEQASLNNYAKALKYYNMALEIAPDYREAWANKAVCLSNLGQEEESIKCNKKAVEVDNQYTRGWIQLGYAYGRNNRYQDAHHAFKKAYELETDNEEALSGLAFTSRDLEKWEECFKYCSLYNQIYNNSQIRELGRYSLAKIVMKLHDT